MTIRNWLLAALVVPASLLVACGSDDNNNSTGRAKLDVTDAPVDGATKVVVEFTGVELQPASGDRLNFDYTTPRRIDLLALTGVESATLLDQVVPSGSYAWVRLKVNTSRTALNSYIELDDGSQHPLFIPSGAESGLKLNGGVTIPAGGVGAFTVDFDLRKSVHEPQNAGDAYFLRPTLRLVDSGQVGAIRGTVAVTSVPTGCSPAVYVYSGSGVVPDDVGGTTPPYDSAIVELNTTSGAYEYTLGFLPAGAYTVAYTCQANLDDPEINDSIVFDPTKPATVTVGVFTTVDFP